MGININYSNFHSSYGMQQIPVVRPEQVSTENAQPKEQQVQAPQKVSEPAQVSYAPQASRIANLEDISLTFNREDSFDNIGVDADIATLDMSKAISDMKRDSILSDYQTFVGPSTDQLMAGIEDGIVIPK